MIINVISAFQVEGHGIKIQGLKRVNYVIKFNKK